MCLEQLRHFSPFVLSTDGLIGKEARIMLKKLSASLAEKTGKPYSTVCGYVNAARMSLAIFRVTHLCLRGSSVSTSQMSSRRQEWAYSITRTDCVTSLSLLRAFKRPLRSLLDYDPSCSEQAKILQ
jgi:hypothetical protein